MRKRRRKLIVIGRPRPFDDAAFKRLLMAYAYYRHDQRQAEAASSSHHLGEAPDNDDDRGASGSQA